jgi:phosphohistidine swiveling domain-containing protein
MDAYQKLRRQGYQPKNVFGSAEIAAQAETKFELEHSVVMAPSIRKEMETRMEDAKAVLSGEA